MQQSFIASLIPSSKFLILKGYFIFNILFFAGNGGNNAFHQID